MNREAEAHDLPTRPGAAKLWYNETGYWTSSNGKGENVPIRVQIEREIQFNRVFLYARYAQNQMGKCHQAGPIGQACVGNYVCFKNKSYKEQHDVYWGKKRVTNKFRTLSRFP